MVAEKMFGFENCMTEVTKVASTQPIMFALKVQPHVISLMSQVPAELAAKSPISETICVHLHNV